MAKRYGRKSAAIREALAAKPDASVSDIVAGLAARRIRVAPAQVYTIRSKIGKATSKGNGKPDEYATLVQAKKLADAMGGVAKARAALAVLAKLI